MDFNNIISTYGGWVGLIIYFLYNQLWPFISKRSVTDREFQHQMEMRRITAQEKVSEAVSLLSVSMAQTNERIATIQTNQVMMMEKQNATHDILVGLIGSNLEEK